MFTNLSDRSCIIFFSAQGVTWQAAFKRTNVKPELFTDIDMLLIIVKRIREKICQAVNQYPKANNKYMKNKPGVLEKVNLGYSPLCKLFNKGLEEDDKKEGLLKRLKNIEDKNKEQ